jgi:hypothetical protein
MDRRGKEVQEASCLETGESPAEDRRKRDAGEISPAGGTGGVPQLFKKSPKNGGLRGLKRYKSSQNRLTEKTVKEGRDIVEQNENAYERFSG